MENHWKSWKSWENIAISLILIKKTWKSWENTSILVFSIQKSWKSWGNTATFVFYIKTSWKSCGKQWFWQSGGSFWESERSSNIHPWPMLWFYIKSWQVPSSHGIYSFTYSFPLPRSGVGPRHFSQPPKHPYYTGRNSRDFFVWMFLWIFTFVTFSRLGCHIWANSGH